MFRWGSAFDALTSLEREFDRLLQSAGQPAMIARQFPPLNLYVTADAFYLLAQVPGVDRDDLEVSVADRRLTLKGHRRLPEDVSEVQYRRRERLGGAWERSLVLPERVDEETISAEFRDGLLKLTLPKMKAAPRQIEIGGLAGDQGK